MPRVPYLPAELAEPAGVVAAVRARRGGRLSNLDRLLLYSPPFASGWNTFMGAVRTELEVEWKLRELAMCVVAVINRARYEFDAHAPLFVQAGGSDAQVRALADPDEARIDVGLFGARERAAIGLTIEMTRHVDVTDATFDAVHAQLGDRQTVELVGVIASYNMVSRFLVALGVHSESPK